MRETHDSAGKKKKAMSKKTLILHPEYNLYEKNGKIFCDSLQVAESFEKRHDNVLRDIKDLDCSAEFSLLNFEGSEYKSRGKYYPKYLLTKDGFMFLVMGYTGKLAAKIKEAYIHRFNQMEEWIKSLLSTKMDFPAFTEAIMLAHEEPKHYHYSNEINMIYRIILGMDAKSFRQAHGLDKGESIRKHLSCEQIKAVETLQRIDVGLLEVGLSYDERKVKLFESHNKRLRLAA